MSGSCLGSCLGSRLVVFVFGSGFVSGSCPVRVWFVLGRVWFMFGFVFGVVFGIVVISSRKLA